MIDIGRFAVTLENTALFLDIDGTLIDLASRPDDVIVPPGLLTDLAATRALLGGALALVSGRAVANIDRLFSPLEIPASGVHGSEFRPLPPGPAQQLAPCVPEELRRAAAEIVARYPGALLEDKGVAVALHWRLAPQAGAAIAAEVHALMQHAPKSLTLLHGHSVLEIKGSSLDKGKAVERFLETPPFLGRQPVFIGDDVTDQAAFAVVTRFGGFAFSVSREMEGTLDWFASPTAVRQWLHQIASAKSVTAVA